MTLPARQLRLYVISSLKSHHNISYTFRKAPAVFLLACSRSSEVTPSPSLRPGRRRLSAMRTRPSPTSKTSSRSSAMPWPSTSRSSPSPRRCGGHWLNEDQYFRILEFCVDCNKVAQLFIIYTHYCARASPGSWYIIHYSLCPDSLQQTRTRRPGEASFINLRDHMRTSDSFVTVLGTDMLFFDFACGISGSITKHLHSIWNKKEGVTTKSLLRRREFIIIKNTPEGPDITAKMAIGGKLISGPLGASLMNNRKQRFFSKVTWSESVLQRRWPKN